MRYEGGMGKSCSADPDELCWWDLRDLACSCGPYEKEMIEGLYYLIPGLSLDEGLRKVYDDDEVRKMGELVVETRCIQLYVIHGDKNVAKKDVVGTQISQTKDPAPAQVPIEVSPKKNNNRPKKLTPKRPNKASLKPCRTSPRNAQLVDPTLLESPATLIVGDSVKSLQLHPQNRSERCSANPSQISLETTPLSYTTGPSKAATEPPIVPESFPLFERQIVPETYQWEDERPDSPIPLKELLGDDAWSDDDSDGDPEYEPDSDSLKGGGEVADDASDASDFDDLSDGLEEIEEGDDVEVVDDEGVETSDDELQTARERVKGFNTKVREIALKLQQDAVEGRLGQQQIRSGGQPSVEEPATEYHSEYEDSDEEIDTPPESGDDETIAQRRTKRSLLVGNDTDFKVFKWRVGQRFPSRDEFKSAVAKYGILQGRNLTFVISNKNRQQRIGVRCVEGCSFKLYSSWDSRKASFVVKTVVDEHTCTRNMDRNRQLKSTWLAQQLLEVFKARPHWPANEIIQTVRLGYRVVVKKDFAYKVKYYAHRLLHGSMKDHYHKVGNYLEALKKASPGTDMELISDLKEGNPHPIFQRMYMCFEGLKHGWKEGCRPIICVDACFLKTFLGGQLLSAVGRDANDQMYPIAWAIVEGENNLSWEWFFKKLQSSLELGEGENLVLISDEHQVCFTFNFFWLAYLNSLACFSYSPIT
ncbi:Nascent polypeptide-associated complex subunit alpha muscle-specific form [Bienertia sinuspersici]